MNRLAENRLDPSLFSREDRKSLDRLSELVSREERPLLVGPEDVRIPFPGPLFRLFARIVRDMREGKAIVLLPEKESFTTQAAANFLGVSRPFLVDLLENGEIPHHRVGTHRRVYLKDLLDYMNRRDRQRRQILDGLADTVEKAGVS